MGELQPKTPGAEIIYMVRALQLFCEAAGGKVETILLDPVAWATVVADMSDDERATIKEHKNLTVTKLNGTQIGMMTERDQRVKGVH